MTELGQNWLCPSSVTTLTPVFPQVSKFCQLCPLCPGDRWSQRLGSPRRSASRCVTMRESFRHKR